MRVQVDDAEADVSVRGEGVPLVLLHGFPFAKEIWDPVLPALVPTARTIAIDLRGMGASSVPLGPYLMEVLAGDVLTVLDALDVERAVVVGHSYGSFVAFAFARMFAERLAGLGIVCGRAEADSPEAAGDRRALALRAEAEGIEPVLAVYGDRLFGPDASPEAIARGRAIALRTDPRGAAATLRGIAERVPATDFLDEVAVPALVIAGAYDTLVSVAGARETAGAMPHGRCDVLPCGHLPMLEVPGALGASLAGLIEDVDAHGA